MIKNFSYILLFVSIITTLGYANQLENIVTQKMDSLNSLIEIAKEKGLDNTKEKLAYRTAEIYLEYAKWDETHIADNINYFSQVSIYKNSATEYGTQLPDFERKELIALLDSSITHITKVIDGKIHQKSVPSIDWSNINVKDDHLECNNKPIFITDFFWQPDVDNINEYFGNIKNTYISPSYLKDKDGTVDWQVPQLKKIDDNSIGYIFLDNRNVADWAKEEYGSDFYYKVQFAFVSYDIDNPGAKEIMDKLFSKVGPIVSNKKYSKLGYMIVNEPHFFSRKGGWCVVPISNYTIKKFKIWLKNRHHKINKLNSLWHTNYSNFDSVQISLPIDENLRGKPIWFDWCRFNEDRVTDWFVSLKNIIKKYDLNAKVHIKYWPSLWIKNWRDHGMDLERNFMLD